VLLPHAEELQAGQLLGSSHFSLVTASPFDVPWSKAVPPAWRQGWTRGLWDNRSPVAHRRGSLRARRIADLTLPPCPQSLG
jgi:hypothetical protein